MYCPSAKFGDETFSGFCVIIVLTHTHTNTHPYRAANRPIHAGYSGAVLWEGGEGAAPNEKCGPQCPPPILAQPP